MTNKEILKKQIIYRSMHRGFKEMDLLLGNFVKKYIDISSFIFTFCTIYLTMSLYEF